MRRTILVLPLLATAFAYAGSHSESTTYIDGNLAGVTPNSGATLTVSDDKQIVLRTGLANVTVPIERISHAELGAVKEGSHEAPFYKFWSRKGSKAQTQLLIVNFKNEDGEEKTMTLELAQPAAASVYESIETRAPQAIAASKAAPVPAPAAEPEAKPEPAPAAKAAEPAAAEPVKMAKASKSKPEPKDPKAKEMKLENVVKSGKASAQWWGDDWWRTKRNSDKWNKTTSGSAPDQQ